MFDVHKGITRHHLKDYPLEKPKDAKSYWRGISHLDFAELVLECIKDRCPRRVRDGDLYAVSANGDNMVGYWEFRGGNTFGFYNPNNAHMRPVFLYGCRMRTTNYIHAMRRYPRRNQAGDDRANIHDALSVLDYYTDKAWTFVNKLDKIDIDLGTADQLLMRAGRLKLMPWSRIGNVVSIFMSTNPFTTYWSLYEAFCHVANMNPPLKQPIQLLQFKQLLASDMKRSRDASAPPPEHDAARNG